MFKVNNKDTRTTPERRSGVFNVNFEHISHHVLVFLLLTFSMSMQAGLTKCRLGGEPWNHSFSTFAKFSEELTFLTPWYAHCLKVRKVIFLTRFVHFFWKSRNGIDGSCLLIPIYLPLSLYIYFCEWFNCQPVVFIITTFWHIEGEKHFHGREALFFWK